MSETTERTADRLENLQSIDPLLNSMRILALSTLQSAVNRLTHLDEFQCELLSLRASLPVAPVGKKKKIDDEFAFRKEQPSLLLVILGSDRGLCGVYNKQLAGLASDWAAKNDGKPIRILAFGSRLCAALNQRLLAHEQGETLNKGTMPKAEIVVPTIRQWLDELKLGSLETVEVLSFQRVRQAGYQPQIVPFLPMTPIQVYRESMEDPSWRETIIEGEPEQLRTRMDTHLLIIRFYELILGAIAAENSVRYALLEEAKTNIAMMMDDLSIEIAMERRQAVTAQIQEIAVSAGLLR